MKKIASMEIRNNKMYINAVLSFLDAIASNHTAIDFARYNRLRYVVGEILANRIEKAYPGTIGTIVIEVLIGDGCCEISIKDKGIPAWTDFSWNENASLSDKENLRNYILDRWTDDIGMEKLGKEGQRIFVRMNILNPLPFKAPEPYAETKVLDTDISIKEVTTEADAIEAIRCIYSEYGYSYSYEKLYFVDRFMEMIKSGELRSFLAVNAHGQTAGHFALAFSDTFKSMPEITTVVTRKEFRGLGLFAKFMSFCTELGRECGFRALMGQPVAFHPMSQKAFLRSGFTATSVLLSYIDSDIESEYNKEGKRLDLFASVKILDESARTTVYPPKKLYPLVQNMFSRLGWNYEMLPERPPCEPSQVRVENSNRLKSAKVLISSAGTDLCQLLRDTVKDSIRRKYEMVELLISLNDPGCAYSYEAARDCGFSLSGLIPGSEAGDYLIMQMLVGADCKYDQLVTVGEFEKLTENIISLNQ